MEKVEKNQNVPRPIGGISFKEYKEMKKKRNEITKKNRMEKAKRKIQGRGEVFDYQKYIKMADERRQKIEINKKKKEVIGEKDKKDYVRPEKKWVLSRKQMNVTKDRDYNSFLAYTKPKSLEAFQLEMFTKQAVNAQKKYVQ